MSDHQPHISVSTKAVRTVRHYRAQWLLLCAALAVLWASMLYDILNNHRKSIASEQKQLLTQVAVIALNMEHQLIGTRNALRDVVRDIPEWRAKDPTGARRRLKAIHNAMAGIRTVMLIDRRGECLAANRDELTGKNFAYRDYFAKTRSLASPDTLLVSPPFNSLLNNFVINLTIMIPAADGSFDGLVGASLDPDYFSVLMESVRYAPDMWTAIVHGDGDLFLMLPKGGAPTGQNFAVPGTFFTRHRQSGRPESLFVERSPLSGRQRMVVMRTFDPPELKLDRPLVITSSRDMVQVMAGWRREAGIKVFTGLISSAILAGTLYLLHRRQRQLDNHQALAEYERLRANEEHHRSQEWLQTFDAVQDSICLMDAEQRIVRCNRATVDMTGKEFSELLGQQCWLMFHADGHPHPDCPVAAAQCSGTRASGEMRFGDRWRVVSVDPIFDEAGQQTGYVHVVRDITVRKKNELVLEARMKLAEYAIKHSLEELLQRTLDEICRVTDSPIGFYHFVDEDQQHLTLQAWSSRTRAEFCTAAGQGSHYPISQAGVWVDCVAARQPVIHNDYAALPHRKGLPEGHAPVIRELVVPVLRGGRIVAILGIGNKPQLYDETDVKLTSYLADIAWELVEHKRTQDVLCENEILFREFLAHSPIYAFIKEVVDGQSRVIKASDNFYDMTGVSSSQMIGKTMAEIFPQEFAGRITADDLEVVETGQVRRLEEQFNGGHYITYKFPIALNDGRRLLAGYTVDITEMKNLEYVLQQERLLYKDLVETLPAGTYRLLIRPFRDVDDGNWVDGIDSHYMVEMVSNRFCEILGVTPDQFRTRPSLVVELIHPDDRDDFVRENVNALSTTSVFRWEGRLQVEDAVRWIRFESIPRPTDDGAIRWTGVLSDITASKQLAEVVADMQTQLLQQEKLASIGQLAAGVAHEINNPIGFIASNLATMKRYIEKYDSYVGHLEELLRTPAGELPDELAVLRRSLKFDYVARDVHNLLKDCGEGSERVQKIVKDLKTFSRIDSTAVEAADLNRCLDSTINIVWNEIKYVAELKRDFGEIPPVSCNAQQINQVFLNLLINAVHAIQHAGRENGEIIVSTHCAGNRVVISVSDNGCGIRPELKKRIFDAFFTTKEVGKGTGLGLSISAEIIHRHGGEISVESTVGRGSTFTITLPAQTASGEGGAC